MKIILIIILSICAAIFTIQIGFAETTTCPEGSYNIGSSKDRQPLCKIEPTGCVHGDSISLKDCEKFDEQEQIIEVKETPPVIANPVDNTPIIGK